MWNQLRTGAAVNSWVLGGKRLFGGDAEHLRHQLADVSLMHGWLPPTVQALGVVLLVCAIGSRSRRWWRTRLPVAAGLGLVLAAGLHWYTGWAALATDPVPRSLWWWLMLAGLAGGVVMVGSRGAGWWRRGSAVAATLMCLLSASLIVNAWVGYLPTVY